MDNSICFAFCVNDGYAPYIGVTIKSIIENHCGQPKHIYVLSDNLSDRSRQLLMDIIADDTTTQLHVIIVDDTPLKGLKDTWSIYTWYRVLLPKYLPEEVHRVLYLDADVVVTNNLSELFSMNFQGKAVAGCVDPQSFYEEAFIRCNYESYKEYICAGVLLMNLDYWRNNNLSDKLIQFGYDNDNWIKFPDQDTINVVCQDSKIVLPLRYGIMDFFFMEERFYHAPYKKQLYDCINNPAIIHYAGRNPWKRELATTVMQDEWDKYNKMLKKPVKKEYITKGWLLFKLHLWELLHFYKRSNCMTREEILTKLRQAE